MNACMKQWEFMKIHDACSSAGMATKAIDIIITCLTYASYATCSAIHHTLNISLGALIFQSDMILNIPPIVNHD